MTPSIIGMFFQSFKKRKQSKIYRYRISYIQTKKNNKSKQVKKTSMLILREISMHLSDYEKRFEFVTSVTRFLFAVDHFVWDYMYV